MSYSGGKGGDGVFQRIINEMPPHSTYIEPFLGMGAVLRAKLPAAASIGIDADAAVIAAWQGFEMPGLSVRQGCAFELLESRKWAGNELVYLDPPYLFETRRISHRPIYRCELEAKDHRRLLAIVKTVEASVMISGYWSEMYAAELKGWRSISFQAMTRGGKTATEWVWMNFPTPTQLHDYRHLGENFRERERIKRKINRWRSRLAKMPQLERLAMSAALAEIGDGGPSSAALARCGDARSWDPIARNGDAAGGIITSDGGREHDG